MNSMARERLHNPVYAQADLDMYEFFKTQGAAVVNDDAGFARTNGCYLFRGRDVEESKYSTFKDHILVLAPHEGIVSSEIWLACRKKLMNNPAFGGGRKPKNTWLSGKTKCARCGAALMVQVSTNGCGYFRCRRRTDNKNCEECRTLRAREVENFIFDEMRHRMAYF